LTALDEAGGVVAALKDEAAGLGCEHLQGEVACVDLAWFGDAFDENCVVIFAAKVLCSPQRIDVIHGDARLAELGGELNDFGEDALLLLTGEIDANA